MSTLNQQHAESPSPAPGRVATALRAAGNAWMALGHAMHKVASPLVLGVLYFAILTPVALVARLCGHDALGLQRRPLASYWHDARPVKPESFRRQF